MKYWPEVTLTRPQDVLMPDAVVGTCAYFGCGERTEWYVNAEHQGSKISACSMHLADIATMAADGKFRA